MREIDYLFSQLRLALADVSGTIVDSRAFGMDCRLAAAMSEPLPTDQPPQPAPASTPPRAFTQGVGLVFQWSGVMLFLVGFFICCASSLLSRDTATHTDLTRIGWAQYSAQMAVSISLVCAVFFGMALAGLGLGLQAQGRRAPTMAVLLCAFATAFWLFHLIFFASLRLWLLVLICFILSVLFAVLLLFALAARREMRVDPPPADLEILPRDYKVPYSHMHQDPPEVRLARELEQRRQRLHVQQKELEMLEEKLRRKLQQKDE